MRSEGGDNPWSPLNCDVSVITNVLFLYYSSYYYYYYYHYYYYCYYYYDNNYYYNYNNNYSMLYLYWISVFQRIVYNIICINYHVGHNTLRLLYFKPQRWFPILCVRKSEDHPVLEIKGNNIWWTMSRGAFVKFSCRF